MNGMFRIVICDDEAVIRAGLRKMLQDIYPDAEVHDARDGRQGMALCETVRPDLVLSDIRMPDMDGLALARYLFERGEAGKCVLLSAYSEFAYAREALRYGVADYLVKPVNRFELMRVMESRFGLSARPAQEAPCADGAESGPVAQALAFIEKNFYRNISLDDVSGHIHVNPNYLSTIFKKQTGMKYIDYLTRLRMQKADSLIRHTDMRVGEIAEMVGYGTVKHFTRLYKETYGENPSEVRQQCRARGEKS